MRAKGGSTIIRNEGLNMRATWSRDAAFLGRTGRRVVSSVRRERRKESEGEESSRVAKSCVGRCIMSTDSKVTHESRDIRE